MGSIIELNDTLRISKAQGFPTELDLKIHQSNPFSASSFKGRIFEFHSKPTIRLYQQPPIRTFLVEDLDGEWVYWGKCHIVEINHDYIKKETSGKFVVVEINTPDSMQQAHDLIF